MDEYWTRGCVPCHGRINCVGSPAGKLPRGSGAAPRKDSQLSNLKEQPFIVGYFFKFLTDFGTSFGSFQLSRV